MATTPRPSPALLLMWFFVVVVLCMGLAPLSNAQLDHVVHEYTLLSSGGDSEACAFSDFVDVFSVRYFCDGSFRLTEDGLEGEAIECEDEECLEFVAPEHGFIRGGFSGQLALFVVDRNGSECFVAYFTEGESFGSSCTVYYSESGVAEEGYEGEGVTVSNERRIAPWAGSGDYDYDHDHYWDSSHTSVVEWSSWAILCSDDVASFSANLTNHCNGSISSGLFNDELISCDIYYSPYDGYYTDSGEEEPGAVGGEEGEGVDPTEPLPTKRQIEEGEKAYCHQFTMSNGCESGISGRLMYRFCPALDCYVFLRSLTWFGHECFRPVPAEDDGPDFEDQGSGQARHMPPCSFF
ncbi:hypothetical protein QOT17_008299 [Balamuthia mandrillaris]